MLSGVVELLTALLAQAHPAGTTLGLFFTATAGPHVDRRNAKSTYNYVLPLALPLTEQYIWVQNTLGAPLNLLAWLCADGSVQHGFRLPLRLGEPVRVDLTEEQLAEFNSSQSKKGPKYDMNNVKVVMPMKTEEC